MKCPTCKRKATTNSVPCIKCSTPNTARRLVHENLVGYRLSRGYELLSRNDDIYLDDSYEDMVGSS